MIDTRLIPLIERTYGRILAAKDLTPPQRQVLFAAVRAFAQEFPGLAFDRILDPGISEKVADHFCCIVRYWWTVANAKTTSTDGGQVSSAILDFPFGDGAIMAIIRMFELRHGAIWNPAEARKLLGKAA